MGPRPSLAVLTLFLEASIVPILASGEVGQPGNRFIGGYTVCCHMILSTLPNAGGALFVRKGVPHASLNVPYLCGSDIKRF